MFQVYVAIDLGIRVIAEREITTVDVSAAEGISVTVCEIEIRLEKTLSILGTQLVERTGSSYKKAPPKPSVFRKPLAGTNKTKRKGGATAPLKTNWLLPPQPIHRVF